MKLIYKQYILKETLKLFLFCLIAFYLLYALLDFSLHMGDWIYKVNISPLHICGYYALQLMKRLELLLPLSLMISTMRILFSMNTKNELLAFRASGIPIKELVEPIFLIGFLCVAITYLNYEFFLPRALNEIDKFDELFLNRVNAKEDKSDLNTLYFKDGSRLIYQKSGTKGEYTDAFWIVSRDEMWHAKELSVNGDVPMGHFVDHLHKDINGAFQKVESFESRAFKTLPFYSRVKPGKSIPYENRSISHLLKKLFISRYTSLAQKSEIQTHCFFKLAMPWLSILTLIACIPFTIRYSRSSKVFITYACGLFGFISFFTIMDGCMIIGCHHLVHPATAIFCPYVILFLTFGTGYLRGTRYALGH